MGCIDKSIRVLMKRMSSNFPILYIDQIRQSRVLHFCLLFNEVKRCIKLKHIDASWWLLWKRLSQCELRLFHSVHISDQRESHPSLRSSGIHRGRIRARSDRERRRRPMGRDHDRWRDLKMGRGGGVVVDLTGTGLRYPFHAFYPALWT